jgi:hypothetical protein
MRQLWHRKRRDKQAPAAQARSDERRLSAMRPMHLDADDDRPSREDKEQENAARRAGGSGGGPGFM